MQNIRQITRSELEQVNSTIRKKFGIKYQIPSGSVTENNKERSYHIMIGGIGSEYISFPMLQAIGEFVKSVWGANEVYAAGIKLA